MAHTQHPLETAAGSSRKRLSRRDRVLVLDGETRAALAVVRSLGRLPIEIGVCSHQRSALAALSRSSTIFFPSPNPTTSRAEYLRSLEQTIRGWQPTLVLPLTDASLTAIWDLPEPLLRRTILPIMPRDSLTQVMEKDRLLALANSIGLAVPQTVIIPSRDLGEELRDEIGRFPYPAVLKPLRSAPSLGGVAADVSYPENGKAVHDTLAALGEQWSTPMLLQQRIVGEGIGVFALCDRGHPLTLFCHRRILEKPPSGGRSVLSESIDCASAPVDDATKLLAALEWSGIAMVEFKRHSDGRCYLMEINPRFWGSLQLAVDAGCDFPALLYRWAIIRHGNGPRDLSTYDAPYRVGKRLRWTLGTIDHLLIRLRAAPARTLREMCTGNPLHLFERFGDTSSEVFRWTDPWPGIAEWFHWLSALRGSR